MPLLNKWVRKRIFAAVGSQTINLSQLIVNLPNSCGEPRAKAKEDAVRYSPSRKGIYVKLYDSPNVLIIRYSLTSRFLNRSDSPM